MSEQLTLFPEPQHVSPRKMSRVQKLDQMCDQILVDCKAEGINPRALLFELKFREVTAFLMKLSGDERWQFLMRLLDVVQTQEETP